MKKQVLVVEDDIDLAETISTILRAHGFDVEIARDADECYKDIKKKRLVLLDIMLPGESGYDIAAKLRKRYGKEIKIIYVSIIPKSEADLSKADGFIQKPFEIDNFITQVCEIAGD